MKCSFVLWREVGEHRYMAVSTSPVMLEVTANPAGEPPLPPVPSPPRTVRKLCYCLYTLIGLVRLPAPEFQVFFLGFVFCYIFICGWCSRDAQVQRRTEKLYWYLEIEWNKSNSSVLTPKAASQPPNPVCEI